MERPEDVGGGNDVEVSQVTYSNAQSDHKVTDALIMAMNACFPSLVLEQRGKTMLLYLKNITTILTLSRVTMAQIFVNIINLPCSFQVTESG